MTTCKDITLFNLRYDADTRREVYIPTNICGVSFYEVDSSSYKDGIRDEAITCKIRIPVDAEIEAGRTFLQESQYKELDDEEAMSYWTLQKGAYVLITSAADNEDWEKGIYDPAQSISKDELEELLDDSQYIGKLITIVEYADNTIRGSKLVQHWRIGGK